MTTITVTTAPGTNASRIGEMYGSLGGTWRNSVDGCNSDGTGVVFVDCPDDETAEYLESFMDNDADVQTYRRA